MIRSELNDYLFEAIREEASDLHITVGLPPMIRVHGKVQPLDYPPLTSKESRVSQSRPSFAVHGM